MAGHALADFAYEPFAQAEIARLEESRLAALEDRIDADSRSASTRELVGSSRRSFASIRSRALHRSADARALPHAGARRTRSRSIAAGGRLAEELGLEPGRALQRARAARSSTTTRRCDRRRGTAAAARRAVAGRGAGGCPIAAGGALLLAADRGGGDRAGRLGRAPCGWRRTRSRRSTSHRPGRRGGTGGSAAGRRSRSGRARYGSPTSTIRRSRSWTRGRSGRSGRSLSAILRPVSPRRGRRLGRDSNPTAHLGLGQSIDPQFDMIGPRPRRSATSCPAARRPSPRGDALWVAPRSGSLTASTRRRDASSGSSTRTPPDRDRRRRRRRVGDRQRGRHRHPRRPHRRCHADRRRAWPERHRGRRRRRLGGRHRRRRGRPHRPDTQRSVTSTIPVGRRADRDRGRRRLGVGGQQRRRNRDPHRSDDRHARSRRSTSAAARRRSPSPTAARG